MHRITRSEYLVAENRILRNQIQGRLRLKDSERKSLAEIGARPGRKALAQVATLVKPETIPAWHRRLIAKKFDESKERGRTGRPPTDPELEQLILRLARENRDWGYDRIQGAVQNLGYTVSDQTVGNILGALSKEDQLGQAFLFGRSDPAFANGIEIRTSSWQSHRLHSCRRQDLFKTMAELGVPVVQQITAAIQESDLSHRDIPGGMAPPLRICHAQKFQIELMADPAAACGTFFLCSIDGEEKKMPCDGF
jgi:Homeodomain-like domain